MSFRVLKIGSLVAAGIAIAVGVFLFGRVSADAGTARQHGYQQGRVDGYLAGVIDGAAQGRHEGRAAQEAAGPARTAFNAGYTAGADDVFAGYDGGWGFSTPYVITVERGDAQTTYRIATREELQPGMAYYVCPDGHSLCQQGR